MGAFNTPANVKYAVAAIAFVIDMSQQQVAEQVLANAKTLFDIK